MKFKEKEESGRGKNGRRGKNIKAEKEFDEILRDTKKKKILRSRSKRDEVRKI